MSITVEYLAVALVVFFAYHLMRVGWLNSEIERYRKLFHCEQLESESLRSQINTRESIENKEEDTYGGWRDEAIEWRNVVIPFVKKYLE